MHGLKYWTVSSFAYSCMSAVFSVGYLACTFIGRHYITSWHSNSTDMPYHTICSRFLSNYYKCHSRLITMQNAFVTWGKQKKSLTLLRRTGILSFMQAPMLCLFLLARLHLLCSLAFNGRHQICVCVWGSQKSIHVQKCKCGFIVV